MIITPAMATGSCGCEVIWGCCWPGASWLSELGGLAEGSTADTTALQSQQSHRQGARVMQGHFNSLWPTDAMWLHRSSGSTLVQVMACCLTAVTAPSYYPKLTNHQLGVVTWRQFHTKLPHWWNPCHAIYFNIFWKTWLYMHVTLFLVTEILEVVHCCWNTLPRKTIIMINADTRSQGIST